MISPEMNDLAAGSEGSNYQLPNTQQAAGTVPYKKIQKKEDAPPSAAEQFSEVLFMSPP